MLIRYSYGGPVVLRLAADHPGRVAIMLLIDAAADPGLKKICPLKEVAAVALFAQMLPPELASSNAELMSLRSGLNALAQDLPGLRIPVTIVQVTVETLVPPSSAECNRIPKVAASVII